MRTLWHSGAAGFTLNRLANAQITLEEARKLSDNALRSIPGIGSGGVAFIKGNSPATIRRLYVPSEGMPESTLAFHRIGGRDKLASELAAIRKGSE